MDTHTIEIQMLQGRTDRHTNEVGVVVPPVAENVHDGDEVVFVNATGAPVKVWFAEKWHEGPDAVTMQSGIHKPFTVNMSEWPDGSHELTYQVFCSGIRELAVGNSPPKMEITKP